MERMKPNELDKQPKSPSTIDLTIKTFAELRHLPQFIDQTEILKVIMNNVESVQFVGAPRKHGKSIKADMIKSFFGFPRDENNRLITFDNLRDSPNYALFKGTEIAKDDEFVEKYFGKYAVLYADFLIAGNFSTVSSMHEVLAMFRQIISAAFRDHQYLCVSEKLSESRRFMCSKWCECDSADLDFLCVESGVSFLLKCLSCHHQKDIFIVIDEADAPNVQVLFSPEAATRALYSNVKTLVANLLGPISKSNNYSSLFKRFFMTGTISSTLTALGNMNVQEIEFLAQRRYAPYYGFTTDDVEHLCKTFELGNDYQQEILDYHNGYTLDDLRIFSPNHCLLSASGKKRESFQDLERVSLVIKAFMHDEEVRWVFEHLISGREVEYSYNYIKKISELQKAINEYYNAKTSVHRHSVVFEKLCSYKVYHVMWNSASVVLYVLGELGCFTFVPTDSRRDWRVKLPNKIVQEYFEEILSEHYNSSIEKATLRLQIQAAMQLKLLIALAVSEPTEKNTELVEKHLTKLAELFGKIMNRNFEQREKELNESDVCHLFKMILGKILRVNIRNYSMKNDEENVGRFIMEVSKDTRVVVIIKVQMSRNNSPATVLEQILQQHYAENDLKKKYTLLAFGICVTETPNELSKNYECKFASIGGDGSEFLSTKWMDKAIYVESRRYN